MPGQERLVQVWRELLERTRRTKSSTPQRTVTAIKTVTEDSPAILRQANRDPVEVVESVAVDPSVSANPAKWSSPPAWVSTSHVKWSLDAVWGGGYSTLVRTAGPTSYWRLGETTGSVAVDHMGVRNGTYFGSPALGTNVKAPVMFGMVPGSRSYCFDCDGVDDYVDIGTGLILGTAYSIEFWANPAPWMRNDANYYGVMGNATDWGNVGAAPSTWIGTYSNVDSPDGGKHKLRHGFGNGTAFFGFTTSNYVIDNQLPNHVVITFNGTTWKAYVNGVDVTLDNPTGGSGQTPASLAWRYIGRVGTSYWRGKLDEVAVYTSAISSTVAFSHYTTPVGNLARVSAQAAVQPIIFLGSDSLSTGRLPANFLNRVDTSFQRVQTWYQEQCGRTFNLLPARSWTDSRTERTIEHLYGQGTQTYNQYALPLATAAYGDNICDPYRIYAQLTPMMVGLGYMHGRTDYGCTLDSPGTFGGGGGNTFIMLGTIPGDPAAPSGAYPYSPRLFVSDGAAATAGVIKIAPATDIIDLTQLQENFFFRIMTTTSELAQIIGFDPITNYVRLDRAASNSSLLDGLEYVLSYFDAAPAGSTLSEDTTEFILRAKCARLDITGTGASNTYLRSTLWYVDCTSHATITFWVYVSDTTKLTTLTLELGTTVTNGADCYQWSGLQSGLSNGWNYISVAFASATVIGSPTLAGIRRWYLKFDYPSSSNGTIFRVDNIRGIQTGWPQTVPADTEVCMDIPYFGNEESEARGGLAHELGHIFATWWWAANNQGGALPHADPSVMFSWWDFDKDNANDQLMEYQKRGVKTNVYLTDGDS